MKSNNFAEGLQNPKTLAIKKLMFELMQNNYKDYDDIISRISHFIVTEKDAIDFVKLINKIYELGYYKAVGDYKDQLKQYNINITVEKNIKKN